MKPLLVYTDTKAEVHVGDTVRYVRYDYHTTVERDGYTFNDYRKPGRFYQQAGTVTEVYNNRLLGVHFPHYAKGANLHAPGEYFRLVTCTHTVPNERNEY